MQTRYSLVACPVAFMGWRLIFFDLLESAEVSDFFLSTDASGGIGYGAFLNGQWLNGKWSQLNYS